MNFSSYFVKTIELALVLFFFFFVVNFVSLTYSYTIQSYILQQMEYKPGFKNIIYMFIKSHKITLMRGNYNLDILPKYFYANAQNATNLTYTFITKQ